MCFKSNMLFIRLGYCLQLYRLLFEMIGADSEPRRQLSTTAARENASSATQLTSVQCRRWRPSINRIFAIKVTFVGSKFLTDFDSQNRCLCSRRSHGPLLRAFCLCFHFNRITHCAFVLLQVTRITNCYA